MIKQTPHFRFQLFALLHHTWTKSLKRHDFITDFEHVQVNLMYKLLIYQIKRQARSSPRSSARLRPWWWRQNSLPNVGNNSPNLHGRQNMEYLNVHEQWHEDVKFRTASPPFMLNAYRSVLENAKVAHIVKLSSIFIFRLTRDRPCNASLATWTQSTSLHPVHFRFILILSPHRKNRPASPKWPVTLKTKILFALTIFLCILHAHPIIFGSTAVSWGYDFRQSVYLTYAFFFFFLLNTPAGHVYVTVCRQIPLTVKITISKQDRAGNIISSTNPPSPCCEFRMHWATNKANITTVLT
jgi:hypothetical protein